MGWDEGPGRVDSPRRHQAPQHPTRNNEQARGVFWCVIITAAQLYTSPNITWCVVIIIAAAQLYLQRGQLGNCVGIQANPGTRHEARIQYPGHKKDEGRWLLCDCHVLDKTHLGCKNDAHRARLPDARFLDSEPPLLSSGTMVLASQALVLGACVAGLASANAPGTNLALQQVREMLL